MFGVPGSRSGRRARNNGIAGPDWVDMAMVPRNVCGLAGLEMAQGIWMTGGQRLELEALIPTFYTTYGAALGVSVGGGNGNGYYVSSQNDNNGLNYKYVSGTATVLTTASAAASVTGFTHLLFVVQINVDGAGTNLVHSEINGARYPAASPSSNSSVTLTGNVFPFITLKAGQMPTYARARLIG